MWNAQLVMGAKSFWDLRQMFGVLPVLGDFTGRSLGLCLENGFDQRIGNTLPKDWK
jgi:hypothetical protein